jgi:hypothetical protein
MSSKPRSRPNKGQDRDRLPEPGESGPLERETAFLQQRLAHLRRRQVPPEETAEQLPPSDEEEAGPPPPDLRQKLMAEYRRRQRAQRALPAPEPTEKPSSSLLPSTPASEETESSP